MSSKLKAICILALILFVSGCTSAIKPDYNETLNRWTRNARIFHGLDAKLYVYATYKGTEFAGAYIDRYSSSFRLDEEYKKGLVERATHEAEMYNDFFLAVHTPDPSVNDLDKAGSIWRLYLETSSNERLNPIFINKADVKDPLLRDFFPYLDLWSSGYIVRFPKYSAEGTEPIPGKDTKLMRLVISGPLGHAALEWRFADE
ncbi:MAG: hypothetical protein HY886_04725 [Deltaproteobacteria bacterium]|nr:hypothetical protein [Deltaproteobacteria bacterium]